MDADIDAAQKAKRHGIRFIHSNQTNELIIRALVPSDDFIRYSLIAGEVIGHARSALEHAVWDLVPSPKVRKTGFPVFIARTKIDADAIGQQGYYDRDGIRMIDGINPGAKAIIDGLQPFGPDLTKPLYVLNELWIEISIDC